MKKSESQKSSLDDLSYDLKRSFYISSRRSAILTLFGFILIIFSYIYFTFEFREFKSEAIRKQEFYNFKLSSQKSAFSELLHEKSELLYNIGNIPKPALIKPIGTFGSKTTANCNIYVTDDKVAAFIIINKKEYPKNYPWAVCDPKIQIGIKEDDTTNEYILKNIDVVEVRRDGNFALDVPIEIRLTDQASEMIGLEDTQKMEGHVVVTKVKSPE